MNIRICAASWDDINYKMFRELAVGSGNTVEKGPDGGHVMMIDDKPAYLSLPVSVADLPSGGTFTLEGMMAHVTCVRS